MKIPKCTKTVTGKHKWEKMFCKWEWFQHWYSFISDSKPTHWRYECNLCGLVDDKKEYKV